MLSIKIAPSILSADFGRLNEEIASVEPYVDLLHVDVMDGHFVPNITLGPVVVKGIRTKLPLDLHLMIENPENYIDAFVQALKDGGHVLAEANITVHAEACKNLAEILKQIKAAGVKSAVSINPSTELGVIEHVLNDVDMVLVMSVNPGFGGQAFMPEVLEKVRALRTMKPNLDIQMDGGVSDKTVGLCVEAGANILVAGSYIFGAKDRKAAVELLRGK